MKKVFSIIYLWVFGTTSLYAALFHNWKIAEGLLYGMAFCCLVSAIVVIFKPEKDG